MSGDSIYSLSFLYTQQHNIVLWSFTFVCQIIIVMIYYQCLDICREQADQLDQCSHFHWNFANADDYHGASLTFSFACCQYCWWWRLLWRLSHYWPPIPPFGFCQRKHLRTKAYISPLPSAQNYILSFPSQVTEKHGHKYLINTPSSLGGRQPRPTSCDSSFMHVLPKEPKSLHW